MKPFPSGLAERFLFLFCKPPDAPEFVAGTLRTKPDNALDFLVSTVPALPELVRGRTVLDFGCGNGYQALALARLYSADVVGLDLPRPDILKTWELVRREYPLPNLTLTTELPPDRLFDVVYSCGSFEHFSDPAAILELIASRVKPGGKVVITFAEPWFSPFGAHLFGFCRFPWANLIFSEKTLLRMRALYRHDGAQRFEDVEGGLNRMTVAKFERLVRASGLRVEWMHLWPVKRLPMVTRIPVLRELLTTACSCILSKR